MRTRITHAFSMTGLYMAGIGICALALFGCAGDPDVVWDQAFGFKCVNHSGAAADLVCKNRPPEQTADQASRYCYKTLADANCFDQPDQDRKNQALGSSGY
jgi:hypothetical protein